MPNYAEQLISKVCDDGDASVLVKYSITDSDFSTEVERSAYRLVRRYADENRGAAPSYATVVGEVSGFTYIPAVSDSYEYLARKLKDSSGKRQLAELFNTKLAPEFDSRDTDSLISWLTEHTFAIKINSQVKKTAGKTLEVLRHEFVAEYEKRKEGRSFKLWRTPFEALNVEIGGLYSGDIYGVMAESGRGKSYLIIVLIDELLRQGARVLVKSYELKAYLWLSRLFSVITAREGVVQHEDIAEAVGVPNKAILSGKLDGDIEAYFIELVTRINEYYPGTLYLQAKGDADLTRSLDDLDRELKQNPDIDVVVIDPIYGISDVYNGKNNNKTTGGAAEAAARRLEAIIGDNDVVGIFAIQAEVEKRSNGDERTEIRLPTRSGVKTTKAALEIVTNLFAFDSLDGTGKLGIEKGRNGGEGFSVELIALMDYGVLRELPKGEVMAAQFTQRF